MNAHEKEELAAFLLEAEEKKQDVVRITAEKRPNLSVEEAYAIQETLVDTKRKQGKSVVGPKMGLTSKAKMQQMNVEEPIYGYIFDDMVVSGDSISMSSFIHPKAEAEVAFILGEDIEGPGISGAQVLGATKYVVPALEIIDSRYENFNFTLPDVIADNASSSAVVFGTTVKKPEELELDVIGTTLSINGEIKDLGAGAAVLGHPANSVAMLANMLHRKGQKLEAGQIILTGGITGAVPVSVGDYVEASLDGLHSVHFSVKE
ncbi:4-oxalocrotonate decarboxylase [Salibacterium salarium]|uniref:4-oxalocrotonate decarboxylase n=1 Tax=Salibacterium salarium TaxID=284579 RepID=A0A3R9P2A9_9BACI|nr:fumarylacetoacetate hydrolase family protein [Salibacterium salarium]RSL29468.1 4-oxalocrotonate decarboxylase [Salibacterium salarium]